MAGHDAKHPSDPHTFSVTEPKSAPPGQATPENLKSDAASVGANSGGFLGAVGGMSLGIMAGPVGLLLGGIAGGVGGWWAGRELADALSEDDETAFRKHYEAFPDRRAEQTYERVRPAYVAGHLAGRNPEYQGRGFEDVEADLRCGWGDQVTAQCGEWPAVRDYARTAFERARSGER